MKETQRCEAGENEPVRRIRAARITGVSPVQVALSLEGIDLSRSVVPARDFGELSRVAGRP
jgi:hypothetical protein